MNANHPSEGQNPAKLEFASDLSSDTGFHFEASNAGNRLRLFATPVRYGATGRLSLMLEIEADAIRAPQSPPPEVPAPAARSQVPASDSEKQSAALKALGDYEKAREDERRRRDRADHCPLGLADRFRGGDLGGRRAAVDSEPVPYGMATYRRCL